jgi:hypothetical protein
MQALLQDARCALSVLTTIAFGVSIDERAGATALLAVDVAAPPRHPRPLWGRSWAEDVAAIPGTIVRGPRGQAPLGGVTSGRVRGQQCFPSAPHTSWQGRPRTAHE